MGLRFVSATISSRDAPGRWSLVVFLEGCNFRCRHCHNWRLVLRDKTSEEISKEEILQELSFNPVLDTLILSGGEPTVYDAEKLKAFVEEVKEKTPHIKVRVDTNGYNVKVIEKLVDVVDGFAIDIKSPLPRKDLYEYTVGVKGLDLGMIKESLRIAQGLPLTLCRTVRYPWLSEEDLEEIRSFTEDNQLPWEVNEFVEVPSCPFNT